MLNTNLKDHETTMTRPNKIAYPYLVEPFQEDATSALSWLTLGNLLLRVASVHAEEHGFGYNYSTVTQSGWVLSRLVVEVDRMPRTGENYAIATWVNKIYRQFTDRLYTLTNDQGECIGQVFSTWALIGMDNRKPVNLSQLPNGGFAKVLHNEAVSIASPERIRLGQAELVATHAAAFPELDINGHINSIRYLEMLLATFSVEDFQQTTLQRIDMAYLQEGHAGDVLHIYKECVAQDKFAFEVRRQQAQDGKEETLVRALLTFKKNDSQ